MLIIYIAQLLAVASKVSKKIYFAFFRKKFFFLLPAFICFENSYSSCAYEKFQLLLRSFFFFLISALLNMESNQQHFKHILLSYYRRGKNAVPARKKLTKEYGKVVMTVQSGNLNVKDAPHSARPMDTNKKTIKSLDAQVRRAIVFLKLIKFNSK